MTPQEPRRRSLAASQQGPRDDRSSPALTRRHQPLTGVHWSPAVSVGMLGATLLAGIGLLVIVLAAIL